MHARIGVGTFYPCIWLEAGLKLQAETKLQMRESLSIVLKIALEIVSHAASENGEQISAAILTLRYCYDNLSELQTP